MQSSTAWNERRVERARVVAVRYFELSAVELGDERLRGHVGHLDWVGDNDTRPRLRRASKAGSHLLGEGLHLAQEIIDAL
jgi:hypothetical protein